MQMVNKCHEDNKMIDRIAFTQPYNGTITNNNPLTAGTANIYPLQNAGSPVAYVSIGGKDFTFYSQAQLPGRHTPVSNQFADAAYGKTPEAVKNSDEAMKLPGLKECQTCSKRHYQDKSNDVGVSYKAPTYIAPENAAAAVAAHEQEHVRNEQINAARDGRLVISQSVRIFMDTCPECGRVYVSGGETRTVTAAQPASPQTPSRPGQLVDMYA